MWQSIMEKSTPLTQTPTPTPTSTTTSTISTPTPSSSTSFSKSSTPLSSMGSSETSPIKIQNPSKSNPHLPFEEPPPHFISSSLSNGVLPAHEPSFTPFKDKWTTQWSSSSMDSAIHMSTPSSTFTVPVPKEEETR
ncbi:hypothetical protein HMI56_005884 [Coelomomyces lativittatus]|nr:hypothetical protein HMI56_005884 [Coelomomyces lativittatus]